jgi:hypothetical protein
MQAYENLISHVSMAVKVKAKLSQHFTNYLLCYEEVWGMDV